MLNGHHNTDKEIIEPVFLIFFLFFLFFISKRNIIKKRKVQSSTQKVYKKGI
jgi:hypothetical protein